MHKLSDYLKYIIEIITSLTALGFVYTAEETWFLFLFSLFVWFCRTESYVSRYNFLNSWCKCAFIIRGTSAIDHGKNKKAFSILMVFLFCK